MRKINKITFENFKFFNSQTLINLNEKNLLIYGENGSGKSSIYWGLYTFLQSVFKENSEVEKYFDHGSDKKLLNIYNAEGENSKIAVEFSENGNNPITKTISYDLIDTKDTVHDFSVKDCSIYSDFINFKLLFNHYNFLHRDEIDLFPIFEKDILDVVDFGIELHPISDSVFNKSIDVWNDLNVEHEHEGIPIDIIESRRNNIQIEYPALVNLCEGFNNEFNTYLNSLLESINTDFLQNGFGLNIDVRFDYVPAELNKGTQLTDTTFEYTVTSPQIKLKIKTLDTNIPITKPQSFLNEAKLSAIALSIRFATIKEKDVAGTTKFLVLDDLLLSLDMNNRHNVIDIVSNQFSDFQILFMTHDRNMYSYMEQYIRNRGTKSDWKIIEMYQSVGKEINQPEIFDIRQKEGLEKAEYHLLKHDYPACGIYLRRECEAILDMLFPAASKYTISKSWNTDVDETQAKSLNDKLKKLKDFCDKEGVDFTPFKDLIIHKSVVLNSLAHNDITSPLYREELVLILNTLKKLFDIKRAQTLVKAGTEINIQLIKTDGTVYKIGLRLRDVLNIIKEGIGAPRISYFSKVKVIGISDNGSPIPADFEKESLYIVLSEYCTQLNIDEPNLLDVLYHKNNTLLTIT